jgi:C-terminal processing protease CtpA/Prc
LQETEEFHRYQKVGNTIIWKMPSFVFDPEQVDVIMRNKINSNAALILDLRNNGGGLVVTLEKLAGYFVEKDTKIADLKGRKEMKPQMAKTVGNNIFKGKLIVLVDSNSGSASEIFARLMQLEQRGVVIGDQSAGAVMQSQRIPMEMGVDSIIPYGMSVTMADVIMTDGKSLEHVGITPNLLLLPTGADMAAECDPVMSQALELLGEKVAPEVAGKFFPVLWRK